MNPFRLSRCLIILSAATVLSCAPDVGKPLQDFTSSSSAILGGVFERDPQATSALAIVQIAGGGYCTGIYIGDHKVLTAAHCLMNQALSTAFNPAVSVVFREDSQDLRQSSDHASSLRCPVQQQYLPRPFDSRDSWGSDLAILLLNKSCPLSGRDFFEYEKTPSLFSSELLVSGFGATSLSKVHPFPSPLKTLNIRGFEPLTSHNQIADLYAQVELSYGPQHDKQKWIDDFYQKIKSKSHFCFLSHGDEAPFFGDSGGPLYTRWRNRLYLLGVFSHIYLLKDPKRVHSFCFQNIIPHRQWIHSKGKN